MFFKKRKNTIDTNIELSENEHTDAESIALCQKDGMNLANVKSQTELICLIAVKQNGLALQYVKEQNENICLTAVKKNGLALKYVKEQTYDICKTAFAENSASSKYINDNNLKNELEQKDNKIILHPELSLDDVLNEAEKIKTVKPPTGSFDSEMKMRSR